MGTASTAAPRAATRASARSFSDEDRTSARQQARKAFAIAGLITGDGKGVCPVCGERRAFKLFDDGWKCFKEHRHPGTHPDAIQILVDRGYTFPDAVNALLDRPVRDVVLRERAQRAPEIVANVEPEFRAVVDSEVYEALMGSAHASVEEAQRFYGAWHIAPQAVIEAGARYVTDAAALSAEMIERFGARRLVAAGLIAPSDPEAPEQGGFWLVNANYPVVEPHVTPTGRVVGMQFRASPATAKRVAAYPAAKERHERARAAWIAAGRDEASFTRRAPRYEPKFLSLRGAGTDSLVGCGLWRVGRLTTATQIYVVEGFKDLLAARTMGREAYAIPGVSGTIPEKVLAYFAKKGHTLRVCLDGDEAGRQGTRKVLETLAGAGLRADVKDDLPEGMDVTDVLVSRHAARGCPCATCRAWRARHP